MLFICLIKNLIISRRECLSVVIIECISTSNLITAYIVIYITLYKVANSGVDIKYNVLHGILSAGGVKAKSWRVFVKSVILTKVRSRVTQLMLALPC